MYIVSLSNPASASQLELSIVQVLEARCHSGRHVGKHSSALVPLRDSTVSESGQFPAAWGLTPNFTVPHWFLYFLLWFCTFP